MIPNWASSPGSVVGCLACHRRSCTAIAMGRRSGLVEALEVVGRIEGIAFIKFDERDVVRHNLVQQIIKAYEEFGASEAKRKALPAGRKTDPLK